MHVGVLTLELFIPGSRSLKEKRAPIKSLKDRISNKFNVSVSEVEHADLRQRATLGISMVSNDPKLVEHTFQQVENLAAQELRVEITRSTFEFR